MDKMIRKENQLPPEESLGPEEIERRKMVLIEYIEDRLEIAKTRLREHLQAFLDDASPYSQEGSECYHDPQCLANVIVGVEGLIGAIQNHIIFYGGDLLEEIKNFLFFSNSEFSQRNIFNLSYRHPDQLESAQKQGKALLDILEKLEKYLLFLKQKDQDGLLKRMVFLSPREMMNSMADFFRNRRDNYSDELPVEHVSLLETTTG